MNTLNITKLLIVVVASALLTSCDAGTSEAKAPNDNEWCSMQKVKAKLKDPDSAKFKDVVANKHDALCYGMVNSKNSMDGYIEFQNFQRFESGTVLVNGE